MTPENFNEANITLGAPKGFAECNPLTVFKGQNANSYSVIISKWKLSPEELNQVNETGVIWLEVFGEGMPPVYIGTQKPFEQSEEVAEEIASTFPITLIHPSYKRPDLGLKAAKNWISKARNIGNFEYILVLAQTDPTLEAYKKAFAELPVVKIVISGEANMVKQVNFGATHAKGNLLVNVYDDFDCPNNWDELLLKALEGKEDYIVKTRDGIQQFIMTLPIMDRKYYERFGFIYNPEYNHMFGDEELACVGQLLNRTVTLNILFPHNHYSQKGGEKKDEVNVINDGFYPIDKITFEKRKARNFDLKPAEGTKLLSILIPSLGSRADKLTKLLAHLNTQIEENGAKETVEVIVDADNGEASIGSKRNRLVERAAGEYIAFIDDDDRISNSYIALLLNGIASKPDCCSLNGMLTINGGAQKQFKHSIEYIAWNETPKAYLRCPNHLNCIKTSIAKQVKFPEINHGEDRAFSEQLQKSGLLKIESKIEPIIYYYDFIPNK